MTVPSGMFIASANALVLHAIQIMRGNEQALRLGQLRDRLVEAVPELEVAKCRIRSAAGS